MHFTTNLTILSKYRTQLMGIAAIMIILCHTIPYGIKLPHIISKPFEFCNIGVEIFLFLSGIGCFYSLSKGIRIREWYKNRFMRIFIPYVTIYFFSFVGDILFDDIDWLMYLYQFSTLSYWTHHNAAWFVALLIPLYLITPLFYKLLHQTQNKFLLVFAVCIFLAWICSIDSSATGLVGNTIKNTQWAFSRAPSYFLGLYFAPYIISDKRFDVAYFIPTLIILGIAKYLFPQVQTNWIITFPLTIVLCYVIIVVENTPRLYSFITWLGSASLESYLANVSMNNKMHFLVEAFPNTNIFQGHYVDSIIIIISSLLITYIGHITATRIFLAYKSKKA